MFILKLRTLSLLPAAAVGFKVGNSKSIQREFLRVCFEFANTFPTHCFFSIQIQIKIIKLKFNLGLFYLQFLFTILQVAI